MARWFLGVWLGLVGVLAAGITIEDRQVRLNGQPFLMKGMCYQPTPVGQTGVESPFGDYFTLGFKHLYDRDLPKMRAMGVNTLRIYNWNRQADRTDFLDKAYNQGRQPIYVLMNAYIDPNTRWSDTAVVNALAEEWRQMALSVHTHPAVIGFLIGNELNVVNGENTAFWSALNRIAGAITAAVGTNFIVTTPLADVNPLGMIRAQDSRMTNFNCWALQIYRGSTFSTTFTDYAAVSQKGLLMTEFGMDAYDARSRREYSNNANLQADTLRLLWREIERRTNIVSGGCVFEWVDEWWKDLRPGALTSNQDTGGWSTSNFPDGIANDEWWGIHRLIPGEGNRIEARAAYSVLRGLWNGPGVVFVGPTVSGGFSADLDGPDGVSTVVERSVDLVSWGPVVTNTLPFRFVAPEGLGTGAYYRAKATP